MMNLTDLLNKLPSFKRIAVTLNKTSIKEPLITNVESFTKSIPYDFLKNRKINYISPEIDFKNDLPYLLVVLR